MGTPQHFKNLCLLVFAVCLPILCWIGMRLVWDDVPGVPGPHVTYSEFVSSLLTAITIVLAALGFFLAVAAFWGYREITTKAKSAAGSAARSYLRSKQGQALLRRLVEIAIERADMKRMTEADKIQEGFSEREAELSKDSGIEGEVTTYPEDRSAEDDNDKPR